MGLRTGINRIALVLKWGAILWLIVGVFAFVLLGFTNEPTSELFLLYGLLFGVPGVIGLVSAYIVGGFSTSEKSEGQQLRAPASASQANDGANESMPAASETAVQPRAPPNTTLDPLAHQQLATRWPRFFARMFDLWWEASLVAAMLGFILGFYFTGFVGWLNGPGAEHLFGIACLPVALVLDAAIYRVAGNTPGKAWLGLTVGTIDGKPLSFSQYLSRNFRLWAQGLAFGIPLVNLFTMVIESRRLREGRQASYDEHTGFRVRAKPSGLVRKTAFGFAFAGLFVAITTLSRVGLDQVTQRSNIETELLSSAKEVARSGPKMIDAGTRLDGATAGPGLTFTYLYTLTDIDSSKVQPGAFDAEVAPKVTDTVCASNSLKAFFDNNVAVQYEYRGKDGGRIGTIVLDRKTCGVH